MGKKKEKDGPKRKSIKFDVNADIDLTRYLKVYNVQCLNDGSLPCSWLLNAMKNGIEHRKYLRKFIVEPAPSPPEGIPPQPPVLLDTIVNTIRKAHYIHINELVVWDLELQHKTLANISLLIEKGIYPITRLELMDCDILYYSVERLARTFKVSNLTEVNLDYNEFGDEGCSRLCAGCKNNKTIITLSLCYCALTSASGIYLGEIAYNSTIREFYLDGNKIECRGVSDMLRAIAIAAEDEHMKKIEEDRLKALMIAEGALEATDKNVTSQLGTTDASGGETDGAASDTPKKKKKKKKKGKKAKKEPDPPVVGPYIYKLHLAENGIDPYCQGRMEELLTCIGIISRTIMHSSCFCELDLEDNAIGNLAAREIMEALVRRKEGDLPGLKMKTTAEIQKDTFAAIVKLASGLKKKKKKGKKKKKKK
uniref:Uncharacterized protein LOC100179002 n=1 Tax=Phallusia mammillata TaxID=59560 RepID=A0A6F9DH06_9ASCI|nr:uncharacterized protein LOC100179002 [Phallusia mammillata]